MVESPSLLCVGNLTLDDVEIDGTVTPALGGDALFAALAARRVIEDVRMLAPVGVDLSTALPDMLNGTGIRLEQSRPRTLPTVRNLVRYGADGRRVWDLLCTEAEFDELSVFPEDVGMNALDVAGVLVSAMSLRSQLALGPWLRQHHAGPILLDIQEDYIAGHMDELMGLVGMCDVFMPSEIEAVALSGTSDLIEAARRFREVGPDVVVIKLAERGCLISSADGVEVLAVEPVEPVDSTGAGDAFCGAFAAAYAADPDPRAAAMAGAEAARVAISGFGVASLLTNASGTNEVRLP